MINFNDYYFKETFNITGNIHNSDKILYSVFIEFVLNKLNIKTDINIIFKDKMNKKFFGYVDMLSILNNPNKPIDVTLTANSGFKATMIYLAHELTHVKQAINNELSVSDDKKKLIGTNDYSISLSKYSKLQKSDYTKYKEIPFESEAYKNEILVDEFLNSEEFKSLRNVDDNLKFVVDNIKD
jgi:hypothetical protein